MATMTAMAITAMMSAYSTRPWPSSSRKNASTVLALLSSMLGRRAAADGKSR